MGDVHIDDHSSEYMRDVEQALDRALEAIGSHIEGEAKDELENAPRRVDTSNLKNSINYQVASDENAVYVGTNVEYAIYVHEGTGKFATNGNGRKDKWVYKDEKGNFYRTEGMPPNRFLKNAVDRNKDQIDKYLKDALS